MNKRDYLDDFRHWFEMIDSGWDEKMGAYVPWDVESSATINAAMLPCLTVMGLEGDSRRAARIPRIIEQLIASPYALHLLYEQANAVRIARKTGRAERIWENTLRDFAESVFGRMLLRDGTLNMVFNSYGWERSTAGALLSGFAWEQKHFVMQTPTYSLTVVGAGRSRR